MSLTRYLPIPSDRMGILWTLLSIDDAIILEYGTAGTTAYASRLLSMSIDNIGERLFTTSMSEENVVMGDTRVLENKIKELDKRYSPKVMVNLVVSYEGLEAAKVLETRFGTPYVYGLPIGYKGTFEWLSEIGSVLNISPKEEVNISPKRTDTTKNAKAVIYADYDMTVALEKYLEELGVTNKTNTRLGVSSLLFDIPNDSISLLGRKGAEVIETAYEKYLSTLEQQNYCQAN